MNSGMIAALAAIAGSFVGAFGSVVGTWIAQRHQDRRDLMAKRVARETAEGEVRNRLIRYLQPNLTPEEIHTRALNGQDPLCEFSKICRSELEALLRQL